MPVTSKIAQVVALGALSALFVGAFASYESALGMVSHGQNVYQDTCVFCHGGSGKGEIPGVPDLTKKSGPLKKSDAELLDSIANGFRSPGSAMPMPAKGGNPELTDEEIEHVLRYLREKFGS